MLADINGRVLTLIPVVSAYSAVFSANIGDDDRNNAEMKTIVPRPCNDSSMLRLFRNCRRYYYHTIIVFFPKAVNGFVTDRNKWPHFPSKTVIK